MLEPFVARLRAPGLKSRWFVLGHNPTNNGGPAYVELKGWGPFPTETAATAARRRLAAGGVAIVHGED